MCECTYTFIRSLQWKNRVKTVTFWFCSILGKTRVLVRLSLVDRGGLEVLIPLEVCRRGQSMFWPLKCHIFSFKLLLDNSACFTSWRMKDLCQKLKVELVFRGAWNSEGLAWLTPTPPPYFTVTDLRRRFGSFGFSFCPISRCDVVGRCRRVHVRSQGRIY